MNKKIENKVAIITGASSGIGRALAIEFNRNNYSVVLAARNTKELEITKSYCLHPEKILIVSTDVEKENDCKNLIEASFNHFGRLDVLINNAGISMRANFIDVEVSVIEKLFNVNFWGAIYCTKYALPYLLKNKGSVVGISSIGGYVGLPGRVGYSASKFALHGFLEVLRNENNANDLHVLTASPGFTSSNIRTNALTKDGSSQSESPRDEDKMMKPDEVAKIIFKAVIKRKREVILGFTGKMIVILKRLIPFFADYLVYKHMSKEPKSPFK